MEILQIFVISTSVFVSMFGKFLSLNFTHLYESVLYMYCMRTFGFRYGVDLGI